MYAIVYADKELKSNKVKYEERVLDAMDFDSDVLKLVSADFLLIIDSEPAGCTSTIPSASSFLITYIQSDRIFRSIPATDLFSQSTRFSFLIPLLLKAQHRATQL